MIALTGDAINVTTDTGSAREPADTDDAERESENNARGGEVAEEVGDAKNGDTMELTTGITGTGVPRGL